MSAPPPARIVEGRDPQKNVLILLEEKIGRAQNQKSGEHFSAGHASGASDGGASISDFENRCELGKIETPERKLQVLKVRLASLSDQIVRDFGRKNQFGCCEAIEP